MTARLFIAIALAGCLAWLIAGCSSSDDEPGVETKGAHLYQYAPGVEPVIRVGWTDNIPDPSLVVAWLIYRGEGVAPAAESQYLTDAVATQKLPAYEDARAGAMQVTFTRAFTYLNRSEQEDGSVDITFDRPALVPGRSYYYRARRVVRPNTSAPPIATAQATDFDIDPAQALGLASGAQGPVTYFVPSTPSLPGHGSSAIDPRHVSFQWSTVTGADAYQVRVYGSATATGQPILQSPTINPTGATGQWTYDAGAGAGALRGGTTYFWTVGARRGGEATPTCGTESGWLKSSVRQFRTVVLPPPTP